MSTTPNADEVYENGQQREEEALTVITENTETPVHDAPDQTDGTAENQTKENDEHHDQEQKPQHQTSEGGTTESGEKDAQRAEGEEDHQEGPKLMKEKQEESDIKADKTISVGTSTVLVETQEVVTSSTMSNQPQRKHSTGRVRSTGRRASYQSSRSYAGGSFQNYGLTYLPYKSNFEPSEDARRRADEFFKTLKL